MPAVIPLIATFAAAGGGVAGMAAIGALATSGVAGFLTVAGGVLSAVGTLSGNKKLTKVGGIMGLAGGLASGFNSMTAANAGEAAMTPAADAALGGDFPVVPEAGAGQFAAPVGEGLGDPAMNAADSALGGDVPWMKEPLNTGGTSVADAYNGPGSSTKVATDSQTTRGMLGDNLNNIGARTNTVGDGASRVGAGTNRVGDSSTGLGRWIRDNKELAQLGGGMLQGVFGPQAEQLDMEKSLLERRRRNLNHVVRVG